MEREKQPRKGWSVLESRLESRQNSLFLTIITIPLSHIHPLHTSAQRGPTRPMTSNRFPLTHIPIFSPPFSRVREGGVPDPSQTLPLLLPSGFLELTPLWSDSLNVAFNFMSC